MSKIYVDQILPKENATISAPNLQLPAGSVLQVVSEQYNQTDFFTTSTTFGQITSISITPKKANSKIICQISGVYQLYGAGTSNNVVSYARILRNGVDITTGVNEWSGFNNTNISSNAPVIQNNICWNFDDSPNTTSSVTYSWEHRAETANTRVGFVENCRVQLMEIAQ